MAVALSKAVWAYRGFVLGSVQREFQARYRNSLLGAAWTVLNPIAMITIYTIIFSHIMKARLPGMDNELAYGIYLCAGVLTWGYFTEVVSRSQTVFIENAGLLKKLSFPRICLPLIVMLNASLNFAIILVVFVAFLIISGNFPGWVFLSVFVVLAIQLAFAVGLGMVLGVLNVFFRDVGQFFTILLQFWFWFTPIVYPLTILPESIQQAVSLNPMTAVVGAYQSIFVQAQMPDWSSLMPVSILAVLLCVFGMRLFRKRVGDIVDEI